MSNINKTLNFDFLSAGIPVGTFDLVIADPPYKVDEATRLMWLERFKLWSKNLVFVYGDPNYPYPNPDQKIIWVKPMSSKFPKYKYYSRYEEIYIYGKCELPSNMHSMQMSNVWEDWVDVKGLHSHRKPPEQIRRILRHHTKPGDIVGIPFSGSGVVEDVCLEMGRRFIAYEIDPLANCFHGGGE